MSFFLTALAGSSGIILNMGGESGCACLVFDLGRRAFHLSPLAIDYFIDGL